METGAGGHLDAAVMTPAERVGRAGDFADFAPVMGDHDFLVAVEDFRGQLQGLGRFHPLKIAEIQVGSAGFGNEELVEMDLIGAHVQLDFGRGGGQLKFLRRLVETVAHAIVVANRCAGQIEHHHFDF